VTPVLDSVRTGRDPAAALADELFTGRADDAQRRLFGYELANLVDNHGRPDLAGRIREAFGVRSDNSDGAHQLDR
jgi:hypothetical protein